MSHRVEVFGLENILCMDAATTESNQVISPKVFEAFALPYAVELRQKTLAMAARMFTKHVCGDQIYELCKQAILKGKDSPRGYILMSGCELAPDTPPYNLYVMKKAVEDFGYY
jgi:hypothetical protein